MASPLHDHEFVRDRILYHLTQVLSLPRESLAFTDDWSFISLGGDSLSAYNLRSRCKKDGILLSLRSILRTVSITELVLEAKEGPLQLQHTAADTHSLVVPALATEDYQCHSPFQERWAECRTSCYDEDPTALDPLNAKVDQHYALTEMQNIMLWRSISHAGSNIVSVFDVYDTKDLATVINAWQCLIEVETCLQMCLEVVSGIGHVAHRAHHRPSWTEQVFRTNDEYREALARTPRDPLFDISFEVLSLDDSSCKQESTIIWRIPHALLDGYSAHIIYSKMRALVHGHEVKPGQHSSRISEQRDGITTTRNRKFWSQQRTLFPEANGKLSHLSRRTTRAEQRQFMTSTQFHAPLAGLSALSKKIGVSLASIYHAAWALTLSAFLNEKCVQFGAVVSGRDMDDSEEIVGNLVNTLPLNISVDPALSAVDYVRIVHEALIDLSTVSGSVAEDRVTRTFDTLMAMQFSMKSSFSETQAIPLSFPRMDLVSDVPLSICIWPDGCIKLDWQTARFDDRSIHHMSSYFENAIKSFLTHRHFVSDILANLIPTDLATRMLQASNACSDETHPGTILDDLVMRFERTARDHPWIIAIEKGEETCTYHELDQRASHAAYHISKVAGRGDVVCVMADRSIDWIVAIYGILKAGGTYSPVDPLLPSEMMQANLAISDAKALLVAELDNSLDTISTECPLYSLRELANTSVPIGAEIPHRRTPRPADDAYLCFTSGSSGKPKGVRCTHEALIAFHSSAQTRMYSMPSSRTAQVMSPAFDGSIHEIFSALGWGSTLVLSSNDDDPFAHIADAHCAVMTPSIAKTLEPNNYPLLKTVSIVGEPLPQLVADKWSTGKTVLNMYGPSEGTCGATTALIRHGHPVTLGRPNPTTRLYILDQYGNICPPEVTGEIFLAGIQVARGYIGRPEETASKFTIDPVVGKGKQKMYRTGDRAFWNLDGMIEYVGRYDRLVKLRGLRLDLSDLEIRILRGVPSVTAVAIAKNGDGLVAIVQPAGLDILDLREQMRHTVPEYAVPHQVFSVDDFPRTPVGKIDYKAISAMATAQRGMIQDTVPRPKLTSSERIIAGIWCDILDLKDDDQLINGASDFLSLGGHSLLQLLQIERLRSSFQASIPLHLVIENHLLSDLAVAIDALLARPVDSRLTTPEPKLQPVGRGQLSPLDKEWFYKYKLNPTTSNSFTVGYAVALDPAQVDAERLCAAWGVVLSRHEILNCRHIEDADGNPIRVYDPSPTQALRVEHVEIRDEINRTVDIVHDTPVRVFVSKTMMVATLSHIICDYTALHALLRELAAAYNGTELPPIPSTFAESIAWSKPIPQPTQDFWENILSNLPPPLFPPRTDYSGTSVLYKLSPDIYRGMKTLSTQQSLSLHQIALAAVSLALTSSYPSTDLLIGAPYLNRDAQDATVVGNFVQALPIRIQYPNNEPTFLHSVKKASQSSLANAIPTNQILSSHSSTITSYDSLLEVMVTLHDESTKRKLASLDIPGTSPLSVWAEGSKFKLMLEFWAVGHDNFSVRAEWDESVVDMGRRVRLLEASFRGLIEGLGYEEIKGRLRGMEEGGDDGDVEQIEAFGTPIIS